MLRLRKTNSETGGLSLRKGDGLASSFSVAPWNPQMLFKNGEQGAWYDPSDFSTLYQDSNGTTPVTALGQPVGLMLDKGTWDGRGVVNLLIRTEEFELEPPWNKMNLTITANDAVAPDGSTTADKVTSTGDAFLDQILVLTNGQQYTFSIWLRSATESSIATQLRIYDNVSPIADETNVLTPVTATSSWQRFSTTFTAGVTGNHRIGIGANNTLTSGEAVYIWGAQLEIGSTATAYQRNGAVVGGPGNHASQSTSAARPTVQARNNLLVYTQDGSRWPPTRLTIDPDVEIAPDGTQTAAKLIETIDNRTHIASVSNPAVGNVTVTASAHFKAAERTFARLNMSDLTTGNAAAAVDLTTGTITETEAGGSWTGVSASVQALPDGWYRVILTATKGAGTLIRVQLLPMLNGTTESYTGDVTKGVYAWGAQLELGSTATTYQRVTTATDYEDIGLPRYLEFDGVDDAMSTTSVDFSGTDEMTVVLGQRKISVPSTQIICELSSNPSNNDGSFSVVCSNTANRDYSWTAKGTITPSTPAVFVPAAAPDTAVITGLAKISTDFDEVRRNGVDGTAGVGDLGTGNFGNHLLYIGARGGTSFEFNGRIHQLIVRGKTTDGNLLSETENYVARKTGVTL